jgi:hypothetical protein
MPPIDADLKVCRIASLTLTNAMIFQQVLAERDPRVESLSRTVKGEHIAESLLETWTFIIEKIDYLPIFTTANEIMKDLIGVPGVDAALKRLGDAALRITSRRAALRHDLMGRIYHRLLADAKYFGAFYTTVPAATLLLKLTLDPANGDIDWADLDQIAESLNDPLHRKLRQLRCLHRRFDCFRVERTSSRAGVAPAEVQRLSRRTFSPTTIGYGKLVM